MTALIAKTPLTLARHIARAWLPKQSAALPDDWRDRDGIGCWNEYVELVGREGRRATTRDVPRPERQMTTSNPNPHNPCIACGMGRHVRDGLFTGRPIMVWICCKTGAPAPDPDPELTAARADERQKELPL